MIEMIEFEEELYQEGYNLIAGIDEAGRGPLVGPVVAAAVILPKGLVIEGLTDSKKLSKKKREYYFSLINKLALAVSISVVSAKRIDEVNILNATKEAMIDASKNLSPKAEYLLIDAVKLEVDLPSKSIIKGDQLSQSIAAASVIAKVTRDELMLKLDEEYPQYNFKNNMGYPTKEHLAAIKKYGLIDEHRRSYKPVKDAL